MKRKTLSIVPIFKNINKNIDFFNFILKTKAEISFFLIVDNTPTTHINKKLADFLYQNDFNYHYINLSIATEHPGSIFKKGCYFADENNFDYIFYIDENWIHHKKNIYYTLNKDLFLKHQLIASSLSENNFNSRFFLKRFLNLILSFFLKIKIKTIYTDGFIIAKLNAFINEDKDYIYKLHDNHLFFLDLLATISSKDITMLFLTSNSQVHPKDHNQHTIMETLSILFCGLNCLLLKNRYLNKNKNSQNTSYLFQDNINETAKNIDSKEQKKNLLLKKLQRSISNPIQKYSNEETYTQPFTHQFEVNKESKVLRLDHQDKKNKDVIVVNWGLTNICNFSCTYCPDELHNGTIKGVSVETVKNVYNKIRDKHPNKTIFFEFTGGEVTYYKGFFEIISFLKSNGCYVGIISNGSRKIQFWEKHHPYLDHICLSFHSEQGKSDHFFDVVSYLTDKMTTHVNIMMKPEKFDSCLKLAQKIAKTCDVSISMQPLLENMSGKIFKYTPEQKEILEHQTLEFSDNPQFKKQENNQHTVFRGAMRTMLSDKTSSIISSPEFISKDMNRWAGWKCYAGVENLVVDLYGDIYRGTCCVGGSLGNAQDTELNLPTKPIICNKAICTCGLDIMCTKINLSS